MKLLTNNPARYGGLKGYGLAVAGRVPLVAPIAKDNNRYSKSGHVYESDINGRPGENTIKLES